MALYFLEYDLRNERDYQKLYDELKKFKAVRILESLWCYKRLNTSAEGLCDHFKQFIDSDDGLVIAEVTDWGTLRTQGNPNDLN